MRPFGVPDPTPVELRNGSRWWDAPAELRGINLRSWLVLELADSGRSITVAELVERVELSGLRVDGRASKTISDALRWEVLRGRVVRLERGRYALGRLARSTKHRMHRRPAACRARRTPADEVAQIREACDLLASIRTVAQTRNGPITPGLDPTLHPANSPP